MNRALREVHQDIIGEPSLAQRIENVQKRIGVLRGRLALLEKTLSELRSEDDDSLPWTWCETFKVPTMNKSATACLHKGRFATRAEAIEAHSGNEG
jgi:hypothetical protein